VGETPELTVTPEATVTGEPPPDELPTTGTVVEQLLEAGWWIVLFGLAFLFAISGFLRSGSRKR
jgi:hypothetical protein